MDCNQRIAFLLFGALILCAMQTEKIAAQETGFSPSPGVNTPKTLSKGISPESNGAARQRVLTLPDNPRNDAQTTFTSIPAPTVPSRSATAFPDRPVTPLKRTSALPSESDNASTKNPTGGPSAGTFLAGLVVVLLLVLGVAKLLLKRSPYSIGSLPTDAVDVLGRRAVDPRNSVYMVKVGSRLILMGASPSGLSSLAEITDPIEIASLTNVCAAAKQTGPDAAKWLSKLWPGTTTVVESRSFDDQLGQKLFEEAQRDESGRVDSLTIATGRERHRAG
jgi:flagellar biogenesis protein FliO